MVAIRYISPIDTHIHFRWNEGPRFMRMAFEDAFSVGLRAVIGQGNTTPPLTEEAEIKDYHALLEKTKDEVAEEMNHVEEMEIAVHGVLTPEEEQQSRLMDLAKNPLNSIASIKIFYVRSSNSGKIEIIPENQQKSSWELGRRENFDGNRTGHFENGKLFNNIYDVTKSETHSLAQPPEAEPDQVERQFRNAYDAGFEGNFIIFHVSNPETVTLVDRLVRQHNPKFTTYLEATPHHLLLNSDEDYLIHGNDVKMNPPLRPKVMQERLLEAALNGDIHMFGTDHAPHEYEKKKSDNPPSGIPGILIYPKLVELLRGHGMKEKDLENSLFHNANRIYFAGQLKPREVEVEYQPQRWERYGLKPFSRVDGTLAA